MKKMHVWMTLVFAGLLLTSCAGVAHIKKDDSVDFSNYRTYAWVETKEEAKEGEKAKADLTEQKIRQAVNEELAREGWRETKAKPDVLLSYDVLVEKSVKERDDAVYSRPFNRYYFNPYTRRWGSVYYPSQLMGYDRRAYEVREGTITISMIDARTDRTVWQGWTTNEVNSRNLTGKEIQSGIRNIFRKFDVARR